MLRHLTGPALCLLLSGLLLTACGPVSESSEMPEALGVVEAAMCSSSAVTTLTISGISTYQGEMAGSGTYAVSYPANAVWLEYRIDGVLQSSEQRVGSSGNWSFSKSPVTCGTHTFNVQAWPAVVDSVGNQTICWSNTSQSLSQNVTEACPVTCGDGVCSPGENCAMDCCEAFCRDNTCCPSSGRCADGRACLY
jgi:hypothetical protein